jgi:hypothetical protein|tara:strand:+ start:7205 stop:7411 length:207 start_codon:yes stop_codon:yes gene_type:complete
MPTLKDRVKDYLTNTKMPISTISVESGVPYGAVYAFSRNGKDMRSEYMQRLYEYFTNKPLISASDEEG